MNKNHHVNNQLIVGKTFLYETLLAFVRAQHKIAIAVGYSGIAALILDGGRTFHSRFKAPIRPDRYINFTIDYNVVIVLKFIG